VEALSVVAAVPVVVSVVPDVPEARAGEAGLSAPAGGVAVWLDAVDSVDCSGVLWFGELAVAVLVVVSVGGWFAGVVPAVLSLTLPEGDVVWSVVLLGVAVEVWSRVPLVAVLALGVEVLPWFGELWSRDPELERESEVPRPEVPAAEVDGVVAEPVPKLPELPCAELEEVGPELVDVLAP